MAERVSPENAGYVLYADLLDQLTTRFPAVALWRLEQIIAAENEAITGGQLRLVPAEVETGAIEMLERHMAQVADESEVA
ncbi:MAG: hypothetical protein J7484_11990 [Microbacterium sp.]|nr:hypothetical protein [Microbacterium sp.]